MEEKERKKTSNKKTKWHTCRHMSNSPWGQSLDTSPEPLSKGSSSSAKENNLAKISGTSEILLLSIFYNGTHQVKILFIIIIM